MHGVLETEIEFVKVLERYANNIEVKRLSDKTIFHLTLLKCGIKEIYPMYIDRTSPMFNGPMTLSLAKNMLQKAWWVIPDIGTYKIVVDEGIVIVTYQTKAQVQGNK